jgi:hypothetical protein
MDKKKKGKALSERLSKSGAVRASRLQCGHELLVHRFNDLVARERRQDDITLCGDVHDGLRDGDLAITQLAQELLALLFGSVPYQQRGLIFNVGRAMLGEVACHLIAHGA